MREFKEKEIEKLEKGLDNEHIMKTGGPCKFNINEDYEYVKTGKLFNLCSNILYYGIAMPILYILTKIVYDLKIEGKENIKNLQTGAVSVSNHVLVLDCTMVGLAMGSKKIYYTALEDSFRIPFVRHLIKLLRAIPIPKSNQNKPYFMESLDNALRKGKIIHFYPEASLWPYYDKIRNFKSGAFHFAIRNNLPIVPMVFTFRKPKGIRKIFKRKQDVTLTILEPIKSKRKMENIKEEIDALKNEVYNAMTEV